MFSRLLTSLVGLLNIAPPTIDTPFGVGWSPITVIGTGIGGACTQQPACCTGNTISGLINVGRTPINVS